jgi:O-acetyl-ADP-ribose deacetylase (regulator of RNase III)
VGDAKVTPGFALPADWVIHTVGPVWHGGTSGEPELLASCYSRSLEVAAQVEARSIAFPAISTGVYGYPKQQAAAIAVRIVLAHERPEMSITLVAHDPDTLALYQALLSA